MRHANEIYGDADGDEDGGDGGDVKSEYSICIPALFDGVRKTNWVRKRSMQSSR